MTPSKLIVDNGKRALQQIIKQGKHSDEYDLWESPPILPDDIPERDMALLLRLFKPDALIWIGERHKTGIPGLTIRNYASECEAVMQYVSYHT